MPRARADLSLSEARRIALAAQGFDRPRPSGAVGVRQLSRTIRQLALLQIDYVNVLLPAHYQVPFSRLGPYDRSRLDDLVYVRRDFTEQWAHEASILPAESWPLFRHRMENHRIRPWGFEKFVEENAGYLDLVLAEVRARGPLTADDIPEPEGALRGLPGADWPWRRSLRRLVLEVHFGYGRLAVAGRLPNFVRQYDLAERVLPPEQLRRRVPPEDAQRELVHQAARAQGVASAADLADYFRMPLRDVRARISELVESRELSEVRVESWGEPGYLDPKAKLPKRIDASALLSPFDPVVWHNPRSARLFEFDYRIELFVTKPKRKWGYYVLPFLLGDRLVARVDLKADRKGSRLLVLAAYLESHAKPGPVSGALVAELETMAEWLGLGSVSVGPRGNFARSISAALRS